MRVTIDFDPNQGKGTVGAGVQPEVTAEDAGAVPAALLAQIGEASDATALVGPAGAPEDAGGPPDWLLEAVEGAAPFSADTGDGAYDGGGDHDGGDAPQG